MYKQPSEFATFLSIWTLCFLSSLTAVEAFCSMSVRVNGVDKSEHTIVVPKETPVVVDCDLGGTLYRGDERYPSFTLTEATQGSYHCRCSGGRRSSGRILVFKPGFEDNERMTLTGFKGDNMTIPCGLTGTLQGVTYKTIWERNYSRLTSGRFREDERDLVIENVTEEDATYDYRCAVVRIGNNRLNGAFIHSKPRRIALIDSPADISHKVTQGEILCSTQDSTTYPGDRYCLYVEDSGGERHKVECDDRPVSGDVEELKKLGNTAVCTVNRTILDPPFYNDTTYEIPDAIAVYGGMFSLKCGKVGSCILQGDWYRNGELLRRNSTTLTVRNATFEDDGTYQCANSGLNNSFLVAVYGQLGISTINCDSKLSGICVRTIRPGQSVELCTRKLVPSTPPEGRVAKFIRAHWRREKSEGEWEDLYECFENGFCARIRTTPPVDDLRYSDVNESCITISDVQEDEIFSLELLVNPDIEYSSKTVTFAVQTIKGSV